jgi:hypothetical protein
MVMPRSVRSAMNCTLEPPHVVAGFDHGGDDRGHVFLHTLCPRLQTAHPGLKVSET